MLSFPTRDVPGSSAADAVRRGLLLLSCALATGSAFGQRFSGSTLPLLLIDAARWEIPDEPKVLTRMRLIDNGPGVYNRLIDPPRAYNSYVGIEQRGSSSLDLFPKVGYKLELRTRANVDTTASLLGMPEEGDWVLHGPYSDKTLIRNAFTYTLAARLGEYAPRTRMVELVLKGDNVGIYALVEAIKRDKNRVDISTLSPDENTGDDLTGGYILKVDKVTGEDLSLDPFIVLPRRNRGGQDKTQLLLHYPKPQNISAAQRSYITAWMSDFERRLASEAFEDPLDGYGAVIDERSFVDFLLINEITRNVDGYRLSTYLYKDKDSKGGRLHMGPVWDFNLAIGNADYCQGDLAEGWSLEFEQYCPGDGFQGPFWYARLWTSYPFRAATAARWRTLRQSGSALSDEVLYGMYDSLAAVVSGEPARRNFERWPVLGEYTWPNAYVPSSHADALAFAKTFLRRRITWLDAQFARITSVTEVGTEQLRLYPNPGTGGAVRVAGLSSEDYPAQVTWSDAVGRSVGFEVLDSGGALVGPGPAGLYFYRITTAGGTLHAGKWLSSRAD